ncbi:hypothetical protein ACINWC323_2552 [Acinetobacter sp. WC-323]|uniref:hypothetical protein n=1 Tax=Acinetobacter sp. WC-323 TaxID=903918 RepID=UPI00029E29B0|nr:hypothetical protein [Acinetobacter sp. WC-323]EKU56889.1 hypothetical protein ACINWC323_2552 [Acinetobacter sp. WC-323]
MRKVLLALGYLIATPAFASSSGEITFSGLIIEETSCQVITIHKMVKPDCFHNGDAVAIREILSQAQLEYLDQDKNLAVMQLTYH